MTKKNALELRQEAIKELIKKMAISDQNQLVNLLKKHYAIVANQAVISRDLRKLGIVKKIINDSPLYELPDIDVSAEILRLALVNITHNESMIVIKTHPGLAAFVGDYVDQHDNLDVLGCLAGENVVFVTPKSIKNIQKIFEKICQKFNFKKRNQ